MLYKNHVHNCKVHALRELGMRLHKVDGQLRIIGIRARILVVRAERPRVIPLTCALHHVRAAAVTMRKVTAPLPVVAGLVIVRRNAVELCGKVLVAAVVAAGLW